MFNVTELKIKYDKEINKLFSKNGLKLPKGHNNCCALVYLPFFELESLTLKQKGILIHLLTRGGNDHIVFKSIIKISKTLNIERTTYTRNLNRLEELCYIKRYIQQENNTPGTESSVMYIYPILDTTGQPINSSNEEIQLSLNAAKRYLNEYSKYIINIKENSSINNQNEPLDLDVDDFREDIQYTDMTPINIFTPIYIAFMENPLISLQDKVIYLYLALRSGEKRIIFEGKQSLSKKLRISTKTLNYTLDKLEEFQYIRKFRRYKSDGSITSDLIYVNTYDNFNGLPEISDSIMRARITKLKDLYFKEDTIKEKTPAISSDQFNKVFSKQLKQLLKNEPSISDLNFDTFIECSEFELLNDVINFKIPKSLTSLKSIIYEKYNTSIINYATALLKNNKSLSLMISIYG